MDHEQKTTETVGTGNSKKKDLKKKRLIVLFSLLGVILLLVALNAMDFSSPTETQGTTETVYIPETHMPELFHDPDYSENVLSDPNYTRLDLTVSYTFDLQTVSLENGYDPDSPFSAFFVRYFEALQKGFAGSPDQTVGFNALFSEVYFRKNATFQKFAPQKVYDMEVSRIGDVMIINAAETEEDRAYLGWTCAYFEVHYRIYENNGTFRRDIIGEEMTPLRFMLLCDKSGNVTINSITYIRNTPADSIAPGEEESLLPFVLPLVWLVIAIVAGVLWIIVRRAYFSAPTLAAVLTFLVSIKGAWWLQLLLFPLFIAAVLAGVHLWKKKKASGKDATVPEEAPTNNTTDSPDTDPQS